MRTRLILNNFEVDLKEDIDISLTLSIADIKDITKRKRSHSKTIVLEGTARNRAFFYSVYSLSINTETNKNAYNSAVRVEALVYEGETLVFDGLWQIRLVRIIGEALEIEGILYSNFLDIYERLGDLSLVELGWGEYDHALNDTNITNSFQTSVKVNTVDTVNFANASGQIYPLGFGYAYGLIDWGLAYNRATPTEHFTTSASSGEEYPKWRHNELIPLIYVRECIEKMFDKIGITYNNSAGNIFEDGIGLISHLLIGWGGGDYPSLDASELSNRAISITSAAGTGNGFDATRDANVYLTKKIDTGLSTYYYRDCIFSTGFRLLDDEEFTLSSSTDPYEQFESTTGIITISKSGKYNFALDKDVTATFTLKLNASASYVKAVNYGTKQSFYIDFQLSKNNNGSWSFLKIHSEKIDIPTGQTAAATKTFTFNFSIDSSVDFFASQGDEIYLTANVSGILEVVSGENYNDLEFEINLKNNTNAINVDMTSLDKSYQTGDTISLASFVPNLLCKDLLTSLIKMFNLYVTDLVDEAVEFYPLNEVFEGDFETWYTGDEEDWTEYVDKSNPIEILPVTTIEAKRYIFKFSESTDYWNDFYKNRTGKVYGQKIYEVDNTYQIGDKVVELPFNASVILQKSGSHDGSNTKIVPKVTSFDIKQGLEKPYSGAPRLLAYTLVTSDGYWYLEDTTGSSRSSQEDYLMVTTMPKTTSVRGGNNYYKYNLLFQSPDELYFNWTGYPYTNLYSFHQQSIQEFTSKDSKILRLYMKLPSEKIKVENFRKYIKVDGVRYRLNIIEEYLVGRETVCLVELLRLPRVRIPNKPILNPPNNPLE